MNIERPSSNWLNQLGLAGAPSLPRAAAVDEREGARSAAVIVLMVLVLLGPIMTFGGVNLTSEGTVEREIGYALTVALALYACFPKITRFSMVSIPVTTVIAFAWCFASVTWAIDPGSSIRRLGLTAAVAWTVFVLVRHSRYGTVVDGLRWSLVGAIIVSYLVVVIDPSIGLHTMIDSAIPTAKGGQWRGVLAHKNFAGAVCALCILLFVFDAKHLRTSVRAVVIIGAAFFLIQSQSKTSAGMLGLAALGGMMFETLSRRLRAYLIPITTLLGSLIWLATSAYADFLTTTVLNPTAFTGRGQIWSTLLLYAADNPVFGAGFGSFWNIQGTSPVFLYGQGYVTEITVGHSGYLDQLVTVGLPGLVLMVVAVMIWPFVKLLSAASLPGPAGALMVSLLMFCIGHNVTESGLFERDAIISTFLFFVTALAVKLAQNETGDARKKSSGDDVMRAIRTRTKAAPARGNS